MARMRVGNNNSYATLGRIGAGKQTNSQQHTMLIMMVLRLGERLPRKRKRMDTIPYLRSTSMSSILINIIVKHRERTCLYQKGSSYEAP